jgi:hypothetical protein
LCDVLYWQNDEQDSSQASEAQAAAHHPGTCHHNGGNSDPLGSRARGAFGFARKGASPRSSRKGRGFGPRRAQRPPYWHLPKRQAVDRGRPLWPSACVSIRLHSFKSTNLLPISELMTKALRSSRSNGYAAHCVSFGKPPLTWSYFPLTGMPYRAYLFRVGRRTQYWVVYTVDEEANTIDILSFWNAARNPASLDL